MNAYFQLMSDENTTKIRLVPPTEGGSELSLSDVIDYLNFHKIAYDLPVLNEAVRSFNEAVGSVNEAAGSFNEAAGSVNGERVVSLNDNELIPVNEELVIEISSDKMSAIGTFFCASEGGQSITKDEILSDLKYKGIKFGIDEEGIDRYLAERNYLERVVLAKGQPPVQGKDAQITYFFNTDLHAKPTLLEDGTVDFFHLNIINHIEEGQLLARLEREVFGTPGTDVLGGRIAPANVTHNSLKFGRNIRINDDKTEIYSMVNGHVNYVDGNVFVSDVMEVENVDNNTGNIEYEGNVQVNGNVCSNFSVKAKGNVEVRGVVEGATVDAGGNITIARGMNGMGKGILRCGGNIVAKFIENSSVEAVGYVECESIMHSDVVAGSEIRTTGKKAFISGGKVIATNRVETKVLGSDMGTDTVVEIGTSAIVKRRYKELTEKLTEIDKVLGRAIPIMEAAKERVEGGQELSEGQLENVRNIYSFSKEKMLERQEVERERAKIGEQMESDKSAQVIVKETVYPGTKIIISEASKIIKDPIDHCRFIKSSGEVRITQL